MSQRTSPKATTPEHAELIAVFDREARRMGSMATLHNHAVADYAGLHQTDQECIDLLDWTGPAHRGRDRRPPRPDQRRRHRARRPARGRRVGAPRARPPRPPPRHRAPVRTSVAPSCGRCTSPSPRRSSAYRDRLDARRPPGRRRVPRVRQRDHRRGDPPRTSIAGRHPGLKERRRRRLA